jgi:hypothetical protein
MYLWANLPRFIGSCFSPSLIIIVFVVSSSSKAISYRFLYIFIWKFSYKFYFCSEKTFLNLKIGRSLIKNGWFSASPGVILFSMFFSSIFESKSIPSVAMASYFFDLKSILHYLFLLRIVFRLRLDKNIPPAWKRLLTN